MRIKCFTLAAALVLAVALVGCSSNKVTSSANPTNSVRPSATQPVGNDRDDQDNDAGSSRKPDASPYVSDHVDGEDALDDVGNAAGDLVDGAGDAVRDAGDAIGDAANNVGRAMH